MAVARLCDLICVMPQPRVCVHHLPGDPCGQSTVRSLSWGSGSWPASPLLHVAALPKIYRSILLTQEACAPFCPLHPPNLTLAVFPAPSSSAGPDALTRSLPFSLPSPLPTGPSFPKSLIVSPASQRGVTRGSLFLSFPEL